MVNNFLEKKNKRIFRWAQPDNLRYAYSQKFDHKKSLAVVKLL